MATLEELVVQLTAESSQLRAQMSAASAAVEANTKKMDDAVKAFTDNSSKKVGFFQSAMATMAGFLGSQAVLGVINKVKEAFGFLFDQMGAGIESAAAQEVAFQKLANALALSGEYTEKSMGQLQNFTDEMEKLTGVEDDVIASNLALLSSMTKLSADGLMTAEKAALDLSAAFGIDLDSATKLIGKGIEGNVEAFKRYGITVKEGQDRTENLANIMKALSGIQGVAGATADTYSGSLLRLNNAYGNLVEVFGNAIATNPAVIAAFKEITKILDEMTGAAGDNGVALKEGIANGLSTILGVSAGFLTFLDVTTKSLQTLWGVLQAVDLPLKAIGDSLSALGSDTTFAEVFQGVADQAQSANENMNAFGSTEETVFGQAAIDLLRVKDSADQAFTSITEGSGVATPSIQGVTTAVQTLTATQMQAAEEGKKLAEDLLLNQETNNDAYLEQLAAKYEEERNQLLMAQAAEFTDKDTHAAALAALDEKYKKMQMDRDNKAKLDQAKLEQAKANASITLAESTANLLTAVAGSQNKAAFLISKAAGIAQAIVSANVGAAQALASIPYPANLAAAAQVKASGLINAAAIAATAIQGLKTGIDYVPSGGGRDAFGPVMLDGGERVVPRETNKDLTSFLDGNGGGGQTVIELRLADGLMDMIEARLVERARSGISGLNIVGV